MGKTATALGHEFGLTAREMNKLLKSHGYLQGEPGNYQVTDLGSAFAKAHDFDNGYGGYAYRQWGWLSWSDGVVEALRASMKQHPDGLPATTAAAGTIDGLTGGVVDGVVDGVGAGAREAPGSGRGWVVVAVLGGAVLAAPLAGQFWREKVKPAAATARNRLRERRSRQHDGHPAEVDAAGNDSPTVS